ncbi:MAG: hypothetical protein P1P88_11060 [Bacteroidales bacterium]|nr:hypothetical protein [Bacteroidales bacterium]
MNKVLKMILRAALIIVLICVYVLRVYSYYPSHTNINVPGSSNSSELLLSEDFDSCNEDLFYQSGESEVARVPQYSFIPFFLPDLISKYALSVWQPPRN